MGCGENTLADRDCNAEVYRPYGAGLRRLRQQHVFDDISQLDLLNLLARESGDISDRACLHERMAPTGPAYSYVTRLGDHSHVPGIAEDV
ncbi:hypothetical protein BMG05_07765 [Mycobacterium malmoense]|nr:hypothetical protein BMG05_07765 [Mycobacterium malmoense]